MELSVGTRVTYDDEPVLHPEITGTVTDPTAEELEYVKTYDGAVGPDYGDVLVQWDDDSTDRSWECPEGLQVLS
jgi:hypothetical protein